MDLHPWGMHTQDSGGWLAAVLWALAYSLQLSPALPSLEGFCQPGECGLPGLKTQGVPQHQQELC